MPRKVTPAQQRIDAARRRRPCLGSAMVELQRRFQDPISRGAFNEWRYNDNTMLMLEALRELSQTPPPAYLDTDSIPVQYGVSSGLSLAVNFIDDPSVLLPALFTGAALGSAPILMPETDYSVDPESTAVPSGPTANK